MTALGRRRFLPLIDSFELMTRIALALVATILTGCAAVELKTSDPQLSGELRLPSGTAPWPAVIIAHGCNGIGYVEQDWANFLTQRGYVVLLLDSLSGRGIREECTNGSAVGFNQRAKDIVLAARALRSRPDVNGHVAVVGFSHGATSVLHARFNNPTEINAYVAFYPYCDMISYRNHAPLLMLVGARDNWTPPGYCLAMARVAVAEGYTEVSFREFPNAGHAFDDYELLKVGGTFHISRANNGRGADLLYDADARAASEQLLVRFLRESLR
jgi:dienelactone hydrolase